MPGQTGLGVVPGHWGSREAGCTVRRAHHGVPERTAGQEGQTGTRLRAHGGTGAPSPAPATLPPRQLRARLIRMREEGDAYAQSDQPAFRACALSDWEALPWQWEGGGAGRGHKAGKGSFVPAAWKR